MAQLVLANRCPQPLGHLSTADNGSGRRGVALSARAVDSNERERALPASPDSPELTEN
jgi:hypothetical protein